MDILWGCLVDHTYSDELFSWLLNQAQSREQHALGLDALKVSAAPNPNICNLKWFCEIWDKDKSENILDFGTKSGVYFVKFSVISQENFENEIKFYAAKEKIEI